jgi:hypothetical protein
MSHCDDFDDFYECNPSEDIGYCVFYHLCGDIMDYKLPSNFDPLPYFKDGNHIFDNGGISYNVREMWLDFLSFFPKQNGERYYTAEEEKFIVQIMEKWRAVCHPVKDLSH